MQGKCPGCKFQKKGDTCQSCKLDVEKRLGAELTRSSYEVANCMRIISSSNVNEAIIRVRLNRYDKLLHKLQDSSIRFFHWLFKRTDIGSDITESIHEDDSSIRKLP